MSRSPAANLSIASLEHDVSGDVETVKEKKYCKELLKSRIFLGRYLERRLIDQRIGYRDIVLVSAAEVELKRDLLEAQHKLRLACPKIHWIGITDSDAAGCGASGVCIWTEIENQPFGPFWFQIKSLKFREDEIIVTLKCLRHISDAFIELEPILTGSTKKIKDTANTNLDNSIVSLNETYTEIVGSLKGVLSVTNVKEFITFFFAFVIAIFTGSTSFVNFLGSFILALIREISIFVKNSTPMFLGLLDFFSKIIGGFYILLAMFFKQNAPPTSKRAITYHDRQRRSNNYDDRYFD
ncbi:uncharacterized protein LOC115441753 [Manduca sexta]|uniref:uncharacterized protein LOC115441753 n=1 Tax=Manduca sexta TaxID=7130 RepID=UPI00188FC770|nr:uncharacterized protein LOC115441753 [Manduca sexta]